MDIEQLKGHGAMLGANAMWGLMSPVAKLVMVGGIITPLVVTDLRVFGAMILFWIASFFGKPEHVAPADLMKLFGASLLAIVFNQGCFIFGVGMTSPVDASIITTSMPLVAMILAAVILKEPVTGRKVLGIAAGASGACCLFWAATAARVPCGRSATAISGGICSCCWPNAAMPSTSCCSRISSDAIRP